MIKSFKKHTYLIKTLVILLTIISSYGQLAAYTFNARGIGVSTKIPVKVALEESSSNADTYVSSASFKEDKQNDPFNFPLFENDEENDESGSFRDHLENSSYFSSILFVQAFGYFFNDSKKAFSPYTIFTSASSSRYVVFHTFRI